MAEIRFFMAAADAHTLAKLLIDNYRAQFVVDGSDRPIARILNDPAEVAAAVDPDGYPARLFVISSSWTSTPLQFDDIHHADGRHRWYVRQRYGGPAFDFSPSHVINTSGQRYLIAGSFSDYPWYYLQLDSPERLGRPRAMAEAYSTVKSHMRSRGIRTRCSANGTAGPWVLPTALRGFKSARHRLRVGDFMYVPTDSRARR